MLDLLRRRDFTIGLIPALSMRRAKAQEIPTGKLPFNEDIVRGNVTLRLFSYEERLNVAVSCADEKNNIAIVTAFFKRRIRLPYKGDDSGIGLGREVDVVLSDTRVGTSVNPAIPLMLDTFEKFPVNSLAFIRVEMATSVGNYEFKPEA